MQNLRKHGNPPYTAAVVHGGPGAGGEMAPVARELAPIRGVLEPLQTATTLQGQVDELRSVLDANAGLPVTLIGFSWGAWLGLMLAAQHPALVKKLVLIGSGPLEERYAAKVAQARLRRLSAAERAEFEFIADTLAYPAAQGRSAAFARLRALALKADAYDPVCDEPEALDVQVDIFLSVWNEAAEMRRSGKLLELAKLVQRPVVAIHGDHDPHPAEGVKKPLSAILNDFRFILLADCGHMPWIERHAREEFYEVLKAELG